MHKFEIQLSPVRGNGPPPELAPGEYPDLGIDEDDADPLEQKFRNRAVNVDDPRSGVFLKSEASEEDGPDGLPARVVVRFAFDEEAEESRTGFRKQIVDSLPRTRWVLVAYHKCRHDTDSGACGDYRIVYSRGPVPERLVRRFERE